MVDQGIGPDGPQTFEAEETVASYRRVIASAKRKPTTRVERSWS
jgi:hypothetical protein